MSRRKALVTGGTRGIGKQIVAELAACGFDVAFTGRTLQEGQGGQERADGSLEILPGSLETTTAIVRDHGREALPLDMDLRNPQSVSSVVERYQEAWGDLDVLVNNAFYGDGRYSDSFIKDIPMDEWQAEIQANFLAPMALIKGFLPAMLARSSGIVINMSTRGFYKQMGLKPGRGGTSACYLTSKNALARVANYLAVEHGDEGLLAFDVDPGPVRTERAGAAIERMGLPETIFCPITVPAKAVAWLATEEEAAEYNGQHFMAQEFVRQRELDDEWESTADISDSWSPTARLDWCERA